MTDTIMLTIMGIVALGSFALGVSRLVRLFRRLGKTPVGVLASIVLVLLSLWWLAGVASMAICGLEGCQAFAAEHPWILAVLAYAAVTVFVAGSVVPPIPLGMALAAILPGLALAAVVAAAYVATTRLTARGG